MRNYVLSRKNKLPYEWFFFCSSRRRHTIFSRDWSSDVCSSDLAGPTWAENALDRLERGCACRRSNRVARARRRNPEGEGRALADLALDPDLAVEVPENFTGYGEPEPGSSRLFGERVAGLLEALENPVVILLVDADAVVANVDAQGAVLPPRLEPHPTCLLVGKLHGVGDEIDDDLHQPVWVDANDRKMVLEDGLELHFAMLANEALGGGEGLLDDGARRDIGHVPFDLACLHLGYVDHVLHDALPTVRFVPD